MIPAITVYLQKLQNTLFAIPEDVPANYHRYIIVSNFMFVFAMVGHAAFSPLHWMLGNPPAFLVDLFCVPLDAFCLYLNHRRRFAPAFGIWVAVMTLHTAICSLAYGWASGFHYYILSLSVFVFLSPWRPLVNALLLASLMGSYLLLNLHGHFAPPAVVLAPALMRTAEVSNMLVNFIILGYLAYHYAKAAQRTHAALEENKKTLKSILAASPAGIALVQNREIAWVNDPLVQMLGYAKNEPMVRDIFRYYPHPRAIIRYEHLARKQNQPFIDVPDTRMMRRDGTTFPCHLRIRPITPGEPTRGAIVMIMDVTTQKAVEQEKAALQARIQRAEKMEALGTLAGGVAHDLNNILSGILSYPELLLMDIPPQSAMRKPLEVIRTCGEKAAAIVQDLLTLARRAVPSPQVVDLNAVITEYMNSPEQTKLAAYHPQVVFQTRLAGDLHRICGSPVHFSKVVMNLVSNAAEAITGSGEVTIMTVNRCVDTACSGYELIDPGDYVVLSVADTGEGISDKAKGHVFEPFYTKKVMGRSGTGLGLAVVWGTVKDNAGYIDLHSTPGRGARFDLYFPRTMQSAALKDDFSLETLRGHGEHVLVVDDVAEQRTIAVGMLERLGYRADAVAGGEAAIAWMRRHRSDLLLLDMIMAPGIDGLETYRRILGEHPGQKAIIASGFAETKRVSAALDLGAAHFLRKPYRLETLALGVSRALQADN